MCDFIMSDQIENMLGKKYLNTDGLTVFDKSIKKIIETIAFTIN